MSTLTERILDAFPAGQYGLAALLRLLDIVESRDVPSAAVEVALQPRMKVNPDFVADNAETSEKLLMLVMHELHHVLLGHTKLFRRVTVADNIVFDAVINALLCHMFPDPEYVSFFTGQNSEDHFPGCLLRPPADWTPGRDITLPAGLRNASPRTQWAYTALYTETGADYHDLFEALRTELKTGDGGPAVLIGNHEGGAEGNTATDHCPGLFEAVREIVERWPRASNSFKGRSLAEALDDEQLLSKRIPSNRQILTSLIRRIAAAGSGANDRRGLTDFESYTPIIGFDRRSVVLTALGRPPLLYRHTTKHRGGAGLEPVHIYLDVSGSIGDLKGALYGAVLDCRYLVRQPIHLFSTRIADVTLYELRRGICRTTGGTDIACVAAHIIKHRVRRAVLLTDGLVGRARGSHEKALASARLGVALTPGTCCRQDLQPFVSRWAELHMEQL
jgi:hypothetical protein